VNGKARNLTLHLGSALGAVAAICTVPLLASAVPGKHWSAVLLPAAAAPVAFLIAFVWRISRWLRTPVPFRVPLTAGQQHGLASLAHARTGNPRSAFDVMLRVLVDVFLFRPLLRATPTAPLASPGLGHGAYRWLWLFAVAFHASLAVVILRHLRLFLEPVPRFIAVLERWDVATPMPLPALHLTSLLLPGALLMLLARRLLLPRVRYISLASDYFPLLLLMAIALTGLLMRHVTRTDVTAVKALTTGLAAGMLVLPARPDLLLVVHLWLVGALLVYFPLSKLMHLPGAVMSPTLTMANTNRTRRYVNVLNPEVATLHYADYEATFRERMLEAGLPVEGE
jgi:nitrate reductase gamma subunit